MQMRRGKAERLLERRFPLDPLRLANVGEDVFRLMKAGQFGGDFFMNGTQHASALRPHAPHIGATGGLGGATCGNSVFPALLSVLVLCHAKNLAGHESASTTFLHFFHFVVSR